MGLPEPISAPSPSPPPPHPSAPFLSATEYTASHAPPLPQQQQQQRDQEQAPPSYSVYIATKCAEYELSQEFAEEVGHVEKVHSFEIIADTSGSMVYRVDQNEFLPNQNPKEYEHSPLRIEELRQRLIDLVRFALVFRARCVRVWFFDRPPIVLYSLDDLPKLNRALCVAPRGDTPLVATVRNVLAKNNGSAASFMSSASAASARTPHVHLLIMTDGIPSDEDNSAAVEERKLTRLIREKPDSISVSLLPCTNVSLVIDYYNVLDTDLDLVDMVDDYTTECQRCAARCRHLSYGDYLLKTLIGPCISWMDDLDKENGRDICRWQQSFSGNGNTSTCVFPSSFSSSPPPPPPSRSHSPVSNRVNANSDDSDGYASCCCTVL
jgi:hypothetical protein